MNPERLERILRLHFDPAHGSAYWLDRQKKMGWDVLRDVRSTGDLWKLGPFPLDDLAARPVEDFVPRKFLNTRRPLIVAETGGATGDPKTTAYFEEEFRDVFVGSFLSLARDLRFPVDSNWLWIGPGGPHVIGKAANAIARAASGRDAFAVDFDPRWYRKLEAGSLARRRYLEHLLLQAGRVLKQQRIGCLFTTPVVLTALAQRLDAAAREAIGGIYLGGMAMEEETLSAIRSAFPNACLASGYGNTLFGVCHCPDDLRRPGTPVRYFPHGDRILVEIVRLDENLSDDRRLQSRAGEGEEGQIIFHRLDESMFLPNVLERDRATAVWAGAAETGRGFSANGVLDPGPLAVKRFTVDAGIY